MEWWQILLIVLGSLLFVYIVIGIIVFCFAIAFKFKVDKRAISISLLIAQKYDMVTGMINEYKIHNINVPKSVYQNIEGNREVDIAKLDKQTIEKILDTFTQTSYQLKLIADNTDILVKSNKYQELSDSLDQINEIYRLNIAIYNSDVTGYNYWVSFKGYRYLLKLFKLTKKEILV